MSQQPAPAEPVEPAHERCPCGHWVGDDSRCIEGAIYGPCDHEKCGGVCEYVGDCRSPDCRCKEES